MHSLVTACGLLAPRHVSLRGSGLRLSVGASVVEVPTTTTMAHEVVNFSSIHPEVERTVQSVVASHLDGRAYRASKVGGGWCLLAASGWAVCVGCLFV